MTFDPNKYKKENKEAEQTKGFNASKYLKKKEPTESPSTSEQDNTLSDTKTTEKSSEYVGTPQEALTAPLDKLEKSLNYYADEWGDTLFTPDIPGVMPRRTEDFIEMQSIYKDRAFKEGNAEQIYSASISPAFESYKEEVIESGAVTEEDIEGLNPEEIFEVVAEKKKQNEFKTPEDEAQLPDSFEELDNEIDPWSAPSNFKQGADGEEVKDTKGNIVKQQNSLFSKKITDTILEKLPEEKRNDKDYLTNLEEGLRDKGVLVDLTGEGDFGEVKNPFINARLGLQRGVTNIGLTALTFLERGAKNNLISGSVPGMGGVKTLFEAFPDFDAGKLREKKLGRLARQMNAREDDMFDSLAKGNFSTFFEQSLAMTAESLPLMAASAMTGGGAASLATISTMSGAQYYLDVEDKEWFKELTPLEQSLNVALVGGAEGFGEWVGGRAFKRSISNLISKNANATVRESSRQVIGDFLKGYGKTVGVNIAEEVPAEAITGVVQYGAEQYAKGKDITFEGLWDAAKRSGVGGLGMGVTMTTGVSGVGAFFATVNAIKANAINREIKDLEAEKANAETEAEVKVLTRKQIELEGKRRRVRTEEMNTVMSMGKEDAVKYMDANLKLKELEKEQEKLTEGSKAYEINEAERKEVVDEIGGLFDKYTTDKEAPKEQIQEGELPEDIASLDDDGVYLISYDSMDDVPKSLKEKAEKRSFGDIKSRKFGVGNLQTNKIPDKFVVTATGSELKVAAKAEIDSKNAKADNPLSKEGEIETEQPKEEVTKEETVDEATQQETVEEDIEITDDEIEALEREVERAEDEGSISDNLGEKAYMNGQEGVVKIDDENENTVVFETDGEIKVLGRKDEIENNPLYSFDITLMPPEGVDVTKKEKSSDVISIDGKEYTIIGRRRDKKGKAVVRVKEVDTGLERRIIGEKAERILKDQALKKPKSQPKPPSLKVEGKETPTPAPPNKKEEAKKRRQKRKESAEEAEVLTEIELEEKEAQAKKDVAEFEEAIVDDLTSKKEKKKDLVMVKGNIYQVTKKDDGSFAVSKMRKDGRLIRNTNENETRQAIALFKRQKTNQEKNDIKEAENLIQEFRKEQEDKIEAWFDTAIENLKNANRGRLNAIGVVPAFAEAALRIARAAYKGGKSLSEALKEGYEYLSKNNPDVTEVEFKRFALNQFKEKPKTDQPDKKKSQAIPSQKQQESKAIPSRDKDTKDKPVTKKAKISDVQEVKDYISSIYDDMYYEVVEKQNKTTKELSEEIRKKVKNKFGDLGYHGGNLKFKAEGFGNRMKGSDVPLTGFYFYSSLEEAENRGNRQTGESEAVAVDFSKYKLFKPKNSSEYFYVLQALKKLPLTADTQKLSNAYDKLISKLKEGEAFGNVSSELVQLFKDNKSNIISKIAKQRPIVDERLKKDKDNTNVLDTQETIALKEIGYEGVDVRNIKVLQGDANPDSSQYGSVIFDIKGDSKAKDKDTKDKPVTKKAKTSDVTAKEKNEIAESIGKARKVKPKNIKGLLDVMGGVFGLNKTQAKSAAVVGDVMVETMAKRAGVSKEEMYQRIAFAKSTKEAIDKLSTKGKKLFQIVGENAQLGETIKENLQVARDMEQANKTPKEIRLATGWEKGKDGKWRYEIEDVNIIGDLKPFQEGFQGEGHIVSLGDFVSGDLLSAYPELKDKITIVRGLPSSSTFGTMGGLIKTRSGWDLYLSDNIFNGDLDFGKSVLLHEIQHAIQDIEGFAKGTNPGAQSLSSDVVPFLEILKFERSNKEYASLLSKEEQGTITESERDRMYELFSEFEKEYFKNNKKESGYKKYKSHSGEVEARNVQSRMGMNAQQRRETTLQETEDVSRDEQIVLFQGARGAMVAEDVNVTIYALTDPNVSTPLHELAHVYEHYLTDTERKSILKWAGTKEWTTETSEKFARGFEKYLAEGKAPNKEIQKHFDNFKKWLTEIYNGITNSEIDIELNDTMRSIFDAMVDDTTVDKKKVKNVSKLRKTIGAKAKKTANFGNIRDKIKRFTEMPLHKITDNNLLEEAENLLKKANGTTPKINPETLEDLTKRIEKHIKQNEINQDPNDFTPKRIKGRLKNLPDRIKKISTKDFSPEALKKSRTAVTRLMNDLRFLENANAVLRDTNEEYSDTEYREAEKQIDEARASLVKKAEEAGANLEKYAKELNNSNKETAKKIKPESISDNKIYQDKVADFLHAVENTDIDDLGFASQIDIIMEDLQNGFIPTYAITDATINLNAQAIINHESIQKANDNINNMPKPKRNIILRTLQLFNPIRKAKEDLRQWTIEFRNNEFWHWDDLLGVSKDAPIYRALDQVVTASSQYTEDASSAMNEVFSAMKFPIFKKGVSKAEATEAIFKKFMNGVFSRKQQTKRVALGMIMIERRFRNLYGNSMWDKVMQDPSLVNNLSGRGSMLFGKLGFSQQDVYKDAFASLPKDKDGLIDIDAALKQVLKDKQLKSLYDLLTKKWKPDGELATKQKIANAEKGRPIEFDADYIPFNRKGVESKKEEEFSFEDFNAILNPKITSDRGKEVKDPSVGMMEADPLLLFSDYVHQVNRDYHLSTPMKTANKMFNGARKNATGEAKTVYKAMQDALKYNIALGFNKNKSTVTQKLLGMAYSYYLVTAGRTVAEPIAEIIRSVGMGEVNAKMQKTAANSAYHSLKDSLEKLRGIKVTEKGELITTRESRSDFKKLLDLTKSPFRSNFSRQFSDGSIKMDVGERSTQAEKTSKNIMNFPNRLSMWALWTPAFQNKFKNITGQDFDLSKIDDAEYIKKHRQNIKQAGSFANRQTARFKGYPNIIGSRTMNKWTLIPFITMGNLDASKTPDLFKSNQFLSSFGARDAVNIEEAVRNIALNAIGRKDLAQEGTGKSIRNIVASTASLISYPMAMSFMLYLFWKDEDEEDKPDFVLQNEKVIEEDGIFNVNNIWKQTVGGAVFLASSKYGYLSRVGVLVASGMYKSELIRRKSNAKTKKEKNEFDKEISNVDNTTKSLFYKKPFILFRVGYKEQSTIGDAAEMVPGWGLAWQFMDELNSSVGLYRETEGDDNDKAAAILIKDVSRLALMTKGNVIPFGKEFDKKFNKVKYGLFRKDEKDEIKYQNPE